MVDKRLQRNKKPVMGKVSSAAIANARVGVAEDGSYLYKITPPAIPPGVVPEGVTAPVVAMDNLCYSQYLGTQCGAGFPGFSYLSQLATRAEYRAMAAAVSTELTREWIEFEGGQSDDDQLDEKIKLIEDEFTRLNVRKIIQTAAEHDCFFGRAQIYLGLPGHDDQLPLILSKRTVKDGALGRLAAVEAIWTTPNAYDAGDPSAPNFYKPSSWFMLGKQVHATRLLTIVTRPLPDILKPAFNFAGMSLSQLAEPYVDNWLRTRQSVSDLISNFSITALKTSMGQVLQGADNGSSTMARAELFNATRSNRGLMLLDKDAEDIVQTNTPLSGLHELQSQSQEHMCSVSRIPAIVLTGISPSGMNASTEGEMRAFYDWIAAQQEAYWRDPIDVIMKLVQLSLFGEIFEEITFSFKPLYQMTPKELSDIRKTECDIACAYVDHQIIDGDEARSKLALDRQSGYHGLDLDKVIEGPDDDDDDDDGQPPPFGAPPVPPQPGDDDKPPKVAGDADGKFEEKKHPRAKNGQFGSGGSAGDPAQVNIPLAKRGNIDKQIDKHKATEAKEKKDKATQNRHQFNIDKAAAERMLEPNLKSIMAKHGPKFGEKELGGILDDWKKNNPSKLLQFVDKHLQETATAPFADAKGNMRSPNLSSDERKIESGFHDAIEKSAPKLIADYHEQFGNVIDPDQVKTLNPEFANDPNLAAAVHEPSSKLAKMIYADALKRKADAGDTSPTVFTAGGSGSGKSTTMAGALSQLGAEPDGLIYDSVLSSAPSAKSRIDQALAATEGDVGIAYTNADINKALMFNALRKRSVSIDTLVHAHSGAASTLRELADHYKDNPRVKIAVMNNLGGIDDIAQGSIADVPQYQPFALREQLVDVADKMLSDGVIDQNKYDLLVK